LHHTTASGAEAIVRTLLKLGANPCVRTALPPSVKSGASFSPLDLACGTGNQSLIRYVADDLRRFMRDARCRLLKSAAEELPTPTPPPVPSGIQFASSDDEDGEEPPPPPPRFPPDFFSPSDSGGDARVSPDFLQRTPPPPLPLPPLPPPLDVSFLARELQVQGLSEEEQVAIAMEERCNYPHVTRT